jgi:hypothetical protein
MFISIIRAFIDQEILLHYNIMQYLGRLKKTIYLFFQLTNDNIFNI